MMTEGIYGGRLASVALLLLTGPALADGPSYDCSLVETGSIEALVCEDTGLSALDRRLADVYREALKKAVDQYPPDLQVEQRGWIKGRDDCWKADDRRRCVEDAYVTRTAELQARYRLVAGNGPFAFVCGGDPANEILVTFFPTDPPTLIAERGDSVAVMYLQPSGSGTRYQGRNESFWEHQGEATVSWGYGAPDLRCVKNP